MKNFYKTIWICVFIIILGCAKNKKPVEIISEENIELQMIDSYKAGLKALNEGDSLYAAKKFNEVELLYPQSEWAPRSILMAAYSYYKQDYYGDAKFELKRFLKLHPESESNAYAHYLLAICYYESIVDEKKDLESIIQSKKEFNYMIKNYPNSDFALDSKFKLDLINQVLASKEIFLGKYYMKKGKWIASINRFKEVIINYGTTIYAAEALHRLVEIHYKIGLVDEAQKYATTLGYNYLSSEWYKESYKVFNQNYEDPMKKLKQKNKNFVIRKLRSLFD